MRSPRWPQTSSAEGVWCLTQLLVQSPLQTPPHLSTFSGGFLLIGRSPGRVPNHAILPLHMLLLRPGKVLSLLFGDLLFRPCWNITSSVKRACPHSAPPRPPPPQPSPPPPPAPHVVAGLLSGCSSYIAALSARLHLTLVQSALYDSPTVPLSRRGWIPLCSARKRSAWQEGVPDLT